MRVVQTACLAELVIYAVLALTTGAAAQVRRDDAADSTISHDTRRIEAALFGPDGYYLLAGGVVLHGTARFAIEAAGHDEAVAASAVTPVAEPGGRMALQSGGVLYQLGTPAGLACPLGRFIERDGLIAYTVVKYMNEDSPRALIRAGVVHRRLAQEFDGTAFEKLLRAADFAATQPLTDGGTIAASLNAQNGVGAFVLRAADVSNSRVGSYVNSDLQVKYRAFLMKDGAKVEIAGVPLRYYWVLDSEGVPAVFSVEKLAQDWPAGAGLSNWAAPDARPTQYDVVNFYQVAGVLRQLHAASPEVFGKFVEAACRN